MPNRFSPAFFITSIIAQVVLGILASTIVMWFSRQREFRADAGGASLAGPAGRRMTHPHQKQETDQ